jgi:hypothetical protein
MIPLLSAERGIGQEPTAQPKKGLFERVTGYQQVVVLLAGFAYVFGYASRALHAFEYNLGTLPGIRFEYLVAGTLLLIPPVALCLALWGVWRSAKDLAAWAAMVPERKKRVSWALIVTFVLGFIVAGKGGWVTGLGLVVSLSTVPYFFMVASTYESASPSNATIPSPNVKWWQKVLSYLAYGALYLWGASLAFLFGLLLLLLFALAVGYGAIALKYVPQEFGGVKPKWGVLDLSPEQLSAELRSLIANPGENFDSSSKVVRSRPLEVFSTSEPWLVRLPSPGVGVSPRSIRLDGKAVLSVEWCR